MPLPVALGPAAVGVKHAVLHAASVSDLSYLSSASLAAVLARMAWNRVPDWIKEDVAFRSVKNGEAKEMERLSSVIEKLQALADVGSSKLAKPVPYLHAAILAYVQLSAQLKLSGSEFRDKTYQEFGGEYTKEELLEIRQALDYATWAYYVDDKKLLAGYLEEVGFSLLHNSLPSRPGYVGHYVATSLDEKMLLIGVKGTSSLEDLLTDCCGRAVAYDSGLSRDVTRIEVRARVPEVVSASEDTVEVASGHERIWVEYGEDLHIRCHEGIAVAAKRLADEVQHHVQRAVLESGYKLAIVGHSLGAGAASLLALILRSRLPELSDQSMQVYAIAPPPVLDHDTAAASAPFITSVVNNSDIIPRSSLANLAAFLEFLRSVSLRLKELGLNPGGPRSTAAFLQKLSQGTEGESIMSLEEVMRAMGKAHEKVELIDPDHLYIPGRVFLMYESWNSQRPVDKSSTNGIASGNFCCTTSFGTATPFRTFEIDGYRMMSDHITASYYHALDELIQKLSPEDPT